MKTMKENWLYVWTLFDPIYYLFSRLEYVEDKVGEKTMMRVRLTKYKGGTIRLSDGTIVNKNDYLLKIHFHNVKLLKEIQPYRSDIRRALVIYRFVEETLPSVAIYLATNKYHQNIKGIIGISTLYKGSERLGFEVFPLRNQFYKKFKQIALYPIHQLSCWDKKKEMPSPKYLVMSKEQLLQKYSNR